MGISPQESLVKTHEPSLDRVIVSRDEVISGQWSEEDFFSIPGFPDKFYVYIALSNGNGHDDDLFPVEINNNGDPCCGTLYEGLPFGEFVDCLRFETDCILVISPNPLLEEENEEPLLIAESEIAEVLNKGSGTQSSSNTEVKPVEKFIANGPTPTFGGEKRINIMEKAEFEPSPERDSNAVDIGRILVAAFGQAIDDKGPFGFQKPALARLGKLMIEEPSRYGVNSMILPTGSGKTVMQEAMISEMISRGYSHIIYVASRLPSVMQKLERFSQKFGEDKVASYSSINKANITSETPLIVTTPNSLQNVNERLKLLGVESPLVILDEGHYFLYRRDLWFKKFDIGRAVISAWTATPGIGRTLDDIGYERAYELKIDDAMFRGTIANKIIFKRYRYKVEEKIGAWLDEVKKRGGIVDEETVTSILINRNFPETAAAIVENEIYHPDEDMLEPTLVRMFPIEQAITFYQRLMRSTVLSTEAKMKIALITSNTVHCNNPKFENNLKLILEAAQTGEIDMLVSVNMLVDSVDLPGYQNLIYPPTTRSDVLLPQLIGRVLRRKENGEPVRLFEISPFKDPESLGLFTALVHFGLSEYHPGVVFTGDYQSYYQQVREKNGIKMNIIGSGDFVRTGYKLVETYFLEPETKKKILLRHLEHGEFRKVAELAYEILETELLKEGKLKCTCLKAINDGQRIIWIPVEKEIHRLLGLRSSKVAKNLTKGEFVDFLHRAEDHIRAKHGLEERPNKALYSPEGLCLFLDKQYVDGENMDDIYARITSMTGIRFGGLSRLIKSWNEQGLVALDITSVPSFVKRYLFVRRAQKGLNELYGTEPHAFSGSVVDLMVENMLVNSVDMLELIDQQALDYFVVKINQWIDGHGVYVIPPKRQNPFISNAIFGTDKKWMSQFSSDVRELVRRSIAVQTQNDFSYQKPPIMSVSSSLYLGDLIKRAEKIVLAEGGKLVEYPYRDMNTAIDFVAERLIWGGISIQDIPSREDKEAFFDLFQVIPGTLKVLCRDYGVTMSEMIRTASAKADAEYAEVIDLYSGIASIDEMVKRLAGYFKIHHDVRMVNGKIESKYFYQYFPKPPFTSSIGYTITDSDHVTDIYSMKVMLSKMGIYVPDLMDRLNAELGLDAG